MKMLGRIKIPQVCAYGYSCCREYNKKRATNGRAREKEQSLSEIQEELVRYDRWKYDNSYIYPWDRAYYIDEITPEEAYYMEKDAWEKELLKLFPPELDNIRIVWKNE